MVVHNGRIFEGLTFAVVLTAGQSYDGRQAVRKRITSHGGTISYLVTRKCDFVLVPDDDDADSTQLRTSRKYDVPIVPVHFVDDCVAAGTLLDHKPYASRFREDDGRAGHGFDKGIVVAPSFAGTAKSTHRVNKVWTFLDPEGPRFHASPYNVAKFAILKGFRRGNVDVCVLEIHVSGTEQADVSSRICVFSQTVTLLRGNTVARPDPAGACRYCDDATTALQMYHKLYTSYTSPPHSMMPWSRLEDPPTSIPDAVGSPQLQKLLRTWISAVEPLDEHVADLVDHVWAAAVGHLDDVLSVQVHSISQEKVEKAQGLLHQMNKDLGTDEDRDHQRQFYELIPQRHEEPLASASALTRQQDLLQLIRDTLVISEATGMDGASKSAVVRYNALDCSIVHLDKRSEEFETVRDMIMNSRENVDVHIVNVFAIHRPMDEVLFRNDLPDRRMLFHASDAKNLVGILSRGLLLPKMLDRDRTQGPGNLGHGIYFAQTSGASTKYAAVSAVRGTRTMLVVQVALGNCLDTQAKLADLTEALQGHDSVHGVKRTASNPNTEFDDDEYAIYRTDQQQLRYLVEFCLTDETPQSVLRQRPTKPSSVPPENVPTDYDAIERILSPPVPPKQARWGLRTKEDYPVLLQAVHVRAQLVDLSAKVVLVQKYTNPNFIRLEARYVFPLDDSGAVCGFEAFINDRHVVGVVEEKREAHRAYQKAVSEGHGAYLLDQEAPDVFVISIGNLPAGATVLIKITYVTELATERELVSFLLPEGVAPWRRELASQEHATQVTGQPKESSLEISVEMPFEIRSLLSPTHHILVKKTDTMATVKLGRDESLDRKFQLLVGLAEIHVPRMWVEHDPETGSEACMLTFYPSFEHDTPDAGTVVFALDASNSMQGEAFLYAQALTLLGLRHLHTHWSFNVIVFGSVYEELFPTPQHKSPENVNLAKEFVMKCTANMGSTKLLQSVRQFFLLGQASGHHQSIFLISDGHLSDQSDALLRQVAHHYNFCRLFTLGIDTDSVPCNRHLMKCLAGRGAGAFDIFDRHTIAEWEEKVKSHLHKAGQPVLTDIRVEWQQFDQEASETVQAPKNLVTLFHGSRQVIYGFVHNCLMATLHARVNGQEMSTVVSTTELGKTQGKLLHTLAARAVVREWEYGVLDKDRDIHEALRVSLKSSVTKLSKTFNVLTSLTSFVAIEDRNDENETTDSCPAILDLLEKENVDRLSYIGYETEDFLEDVPISATNQSRHSTASPNILHRRATMESNRPLPAFLGEVWDKEAGPQKPPKILQQKKKKTTHVAECERPVIVPMCSVLEAAPRDLELDSRSDEMQQQMVAMSSGPRRMKRMVRKSFLSRSDIPKPITPGTSDEPHFDETLSLDSAILQSARPSFTLANLQSSAYSAVLCCSDTTEPQTCSFGSAPTVKANLCTFKKTKAHGRSLDLGSFGSNSQEQSELPSVEFLSYTPYSTYADLVESKRWAEKPYPCLFGGGGGGGGDSDTHTSSSELHSGSSSVSESSGFTVDENDEDDQLLEYEDDDGQEQSAGPQFGGGLPLCSRILNLIEKDRLLPDSIARCLSRGKYGSAAKLQQIQDQIRQELADDCNANDTVENILQTQHPDGHFGPASMRRWIDDEKMKRVLNEAGLNSLGDAKFAILNLCATLVALFRLLHYFGIADDEVDAWVRLLVGHISQRQVARIVNALLYAAWVDQRHVLAYATLQVAPNWECFVRKFCTFMH